MAPVGSVALWAGLGTGQPGIQQCGITCNWDGKAMTYSAWYQMYPADPVAFDPEKYPVSHGDHLRFYVERAGSEYALEIMNYTKSWHAVTRQTYGHAPVEAEVIAEAFGPEPCGLEPTTFSAISGTLDVNYKYEWPFGGQTLQVVNTHEFEFRRT